ncbi:MAG: hypothetical protein EOP45_21320, partial [Sphingobacteriaceae bacterium]
MKKVPPALASRILERLGACKKVLLLTATPFLHDDSDIRILINIAAGKNVLEISEAGFREIYYRVSKFHVFTFGWFFSILNSMYHTGATNIAELTNAYEVLTLGESSWNAKELQDAAKADQTGILGPVVPIVTLLAQGLAHLMRILNVNRLFKLNKTKFINNASVYVDYVPRYPNKNFPSVKRVTKTVEYNKYQVDIWVRFLVNKLQNHERKRLGMRSSNRLNMMTSPDNFAPIQVDLIDTEMYRNIGRCIGNLHFANTSSGGDHLSQQIVEPRKFEMILSIMMQTSSSSAGKSSALPQGIVIYSNYFNEGIKLISDFFLRHGVKHDILTSKKSLKDKQRMLE